MHVCAFTSAEGGWISISRWVACVLANGVLTQTEPIWCAGLRPGCCLLGLSQARTPCLGLCSRRGSRWGQSPVCLHVWLMLSNTGGLSGSFQLAVFEQRSTYWRLNCGATLQRWSKGTWQEHKREERRKSRRLKVEECRRSERREGTQGDLTKPKTPCKCFGVN